MSFNLYDCRTIKIMKHFFVNNFMRKISLMLILQTMQYDTNDAKKNSGQKLNKNIFCMKCILEKKKFSYHSEYCNTKKNSKNAAMLYYLQNIFHIFFLFESLGIYTQNTLYTSM